VGNHELSDNADRDARANTAAFLAGADPDLSAERLWYRKDAGPAVFLFLDTNDLTYGPDGQRDACLPVLEDGSREAAQVAWLREQVAELSGREALVVAVMHHPLVQSSSKHSAQGAALWNLTDRGETLADLLIDAGVDLVLTGHTHTYERFRLVRDDGRVLHHVNVSGRPRDAVLWIGAGSRRSRDIRGHEKEWLADHGWQDLDRWAIHQEAHLRKRVEANQFVLFTAEPDGGLSMEVRLLSEEDPDGTRTADRVRLR
jgi:hypothetical protein